MSLAACDKPSTREDVHWIPTFRRHLEAQSRRSFGVGEWDIRNCFGKLNHPGKPAHRRLGILPQQLKTSPLFALIVVVGRVHQEDIRRAVQCDLGDVTLTRYNRPKSSDFLAENSSRDRMPLPPIRPTARSLQIYPFPEPTRRGTARLASLSVPGRSGLRHQSLSVPGRSGLRHQWRRRASSRQGRSRIDW